MNVTAVFIVFIVAMSIVKLVELVMKKHPDSKRVDDGQLAAYQRQIDELKERVATLEAIVTDESYELKKKFKDLDNDKVA